MRWIRKHWLPITTLIVGLIIGAALGAGGSEDDKVSEPQTKTVTSIVEREVEVAVETVPDACLDALDTAEQIFIASADFAGLAAENFAVLGEAFDAAANFDVAGIEAAAAEAEGFVEQYGAINARVEPLSATYRDQAADCRDA